MVANDPRTHVRGYVAECLSETIFTQADTWEELRSNVREVVAAYFFDQPASVPASIRLHLVRDEVLLSACSCRVT